MAPRRNTRNPYLIPLAATAVTAAASFALYYLLAPSASSPDTLGHESDVSIRSTRAKPATKSAGTSTGSARPSPDKPTILVVVRESTSPSRLLAALPTPLPLDRVNVFVAIHSPETTVHPLSVPSDVGGSGSGGRKTHLVYEQASGLFPPEVPLEVLLPFSSVESIVPVLKQLGPRTVYIEGELLGEEAEKTVGSVLDGGWVGGVVVTAESGTVGRKVAEQTRRFGKRCVVCDAETVENDWNSRV